MLTNPKALIGYLKQYLQEVDSSCLPPTVKDLLKRETVYTGTVLEGFRRNVHASDFKIFLKINELWNRLDNEEERRLVLDSMNKEFCDAVVRTFTVAELSMCDESLKFEKVASLVKLFEAIKNTNKSNE